MMTEMPVVHTYSRGYAATHFHEVMRVLHRGDRVRIVNLVDSTEEWLTLSGKPAGVVPDLTLERAWRKRASLGASNARTRGTGKAAAG